MPWKLVSAPARVAVFGCASLAVRAERPDLVHIHNARHALHGPLSGRPYVVHCHGTDVRGIQPGRGWGRELGPLLRGAAVVLYATSDLASDVHAFRPESRYLPNPIDVERFAPRPPAIEPTRDVLVGVRLDSMKGFERIEALVARLRKARPSTTFTVIDHGSGVRRVLAAAGPSAQLVPHQDRAALPALLREHRIAVGQQFLGAVGNYELEALAAGIPILMELRTVGDAIAVPPVVSGGIDTLTERAIDLLADPEALLALARVGTEWVRLHHDPDVVASTLLGIYREVLPLQ